MIGRLLSLASVLVVFVLHAAPSQAQPSRYVLVADQSGQQDYCTGSWAHVTSVVTSMNPAGTVLHGLDRALAEEARFSPDGRTVAWARGRALWFGDLSSGRSRQLGRTPRGSRPSEFELADGGRAAVWQKLGATSSTATFTDRVRGRLVRHVVAGATLSTPSLSADGRFADYRKSGALWVRATAGASSRRLGPADEAGWSPAGDRLAFLSAGVLHVLELPTGRIVEASVDPFTDWLAWSPDGRYVASGSTVIDVVTGGQPALPPFPPSGNSWRPGHPHQLVREAYDPAVGSEFDVVDAASGSELWRASRVGRLAWSDDGRWVVDNGLALEHASGAPADIPVELDRQWTRNPQWLAPDRLVLDGTDVLRVAQPPRWISRVMARSAHGHLVTVRAFSASSAGLRLLARVFAPRARASDC